MPGEICGLLQPEQPLDTFEQRAVGLGNRFAARPAHQAMRTGCQRLSQCMGMIGALHPIEADQQIDIAPPIWVRACDARVELHHPVAGLIGWRLLTD